MTYINLCTWARSAVLQGRPLWRGTALGVIGGLPVTGAERLRLGDTTIVLDLDGVLRGVVVFYKKGAHLRKALPAHKMSQIWDEFLRSFQVLCCETDRSWIWGGLLFIYWQQGELGFSLNQLVLPKKRVCVPSILPMNAAPFKLMMMNMIIVQWSRINLLLNLIRLKCKDHETDVSHSEIISQWNTY